MRQLKETIRKRGFSVINMGDDAEVAYHKSIIAKPTQNAKTEKYSRLLSVETPCETT